MKIAKATAAKISAYYTSWVDGEEFGKAAESNTVYRQRHHIGHHPEFCFYVMSGNHEEAPIHLLCDSTELPNLCLVLPSDQVTLRLLSLIWLVNISRGPYSSDNIFEVDLVGVVDNEGPGGEARYGCLWFGSTLDLFGAVERETKRRCEANLTIQPYTNQPVMDKDNVSSFDLVLQNSASSILEAMRSHAVTLKEINDYTHRTER